MRIPRIYKNDNDEKIADKITEVEVKSEQLDPVIYIPDVDFEDPKSVTRYIKSIKSVVRGSKEYKEFVRFLKSKLNLNLFRDIRLNGLRNIEDDLYEFNIRLKNVSDEEEALNLLRQINMRLAIIDDYLLDNKLDESGI